MQGKGTVKNPLTVIAIFAGTAEISGTAILPLLDAGAQSTYIWFLMLFPFTLIALFFITLNWNHKVLYAPSDFKDEDHFVNILQKASLKDQIEVFDGEVNEGAENIESVTDDSSLTEEANQKTNLSGQSHLPEDEHPLVTAIQLAEEESGISTRETRELQRKLMAAVHRTSKRDSEMAEKLVLEKLENELGVKIETDMKFEFGNRRYVFDGVARSGNQLTAVEVRFLRDMKMSMDSSMFMRTLDRAAELYDSLSDSQRKEFSFIFAIVTDKLDERRLDFIKKRVSSMNFPAVVKVYDFDKLAGELLSNAS
ncbi:hypothetical protein ABXY91_001534 [Vibrio fluvialis]